MTRMDFCEHAQAALRRADALLARLAAEVAAECGHMSRPHRCHAREDLAELRHRNAHLHAACRELSAAPADAIAAQWRGFLANYEEYLDAWRQIRCELAREEYLDDTGARAGAGPD